MSYQKCVFFRESYDCETKEKDQSKFRGKMVKANQKTNEYSFAFKVEDALMRMDMSYQDGCVNIKQEFSSAVSNMKLELGKKHIYSMTLSTGYNLEFLIEATDIVFKEENIVLKYKLIDKLKRDTISLIEIRICGEE